MNYTCAAREEADDHAADRQAAFSAPSPASTDLTAVQEADDHAADRPAAFSVRFTPPAQLAREPVSWRTPGNGHIPTSLISSV
jgi:hypothetical protein